MGKEAPEGQLHLPPGFRFYPTDEELVVQYLSRQASSQPFAASIIAEVDLYKFDPWVLPEKALFGEKEWYFFSPRDRKYPNGSRPNRAAGSGYWKATGTDKPIISGGSRKVGVKKALVFYIGKAPRGTKTSWIMHEYRLADGSGRATKKKGSLRLDDWVLCRIYKKSSSAQKGARKPHSGELEDVLASLPDIDDHRLANLPQLNSLRPLMDEKPSTILGKNDQMTDNISRCAWKNAVAPSDMGFYHIEQDYNAPTDEAVNGVATAASPSRYYANDGRSNAYLGGLPPLLHIEYHGGKPRRSIHDCPDEEVDSTFRLHPTDNLFVQSPVHQQSALINFNNRANRPPPILPQQQLDPVVTSVFDSAFLASLGVDYPHRPQ